MNRRNLMSSSAIVAVSAVAACAAGSSAATATASIVNAIQYVLPLADILAVAVAAAVPAAAPIITAALPYLNEAGVVFQGLAASMTQIEAQPIVQQISKDVQNVYTAIQQGMAQAPRNPTIVALQPKLAQCDAVIQALIAFYQGVSTMPKAYAPVALPLLHK